LLDEKVKAKEILNLASRRIRLNEDIESEATALVEFGFKPLDALHLTFAAHADVEYFSTCDDKLLKRARARSKVRLVLTVVERKIGV
jgi:predicted nucleic acid-binding protein